MWSSFYIFHSSKSLASLNINPQWTFAFQYNNTLLCASFDTESKHICPFLCRFAKDQYQLEMVASDYHWHKSYINLSPRFSDDDTAVTLDIFKQALGISSWNIYIQVAQRSVALWEAKVFHKSIISFNFILLSPHVPQATQKPEEKEPKISLQYRQNRIAVQTVFLFAIEN